MSCTGLRLAVLTSATLLMSALGLGWLPPLLGEVPSAIPYLGLLSLMTALGILAGAFVLSLLPGSKERLSRCIH